MALLHVDYYSMALSGTSDFYAVLPNDVPPMMNGGNPAYERPTKTLVLLHGYSGNSTDWITSSSVRDLSMLYNLAIIMPSGRNSFYLDKEVSGEKYATYVGEELISYCRKNFGLSDKAEDTFIGGLSMGGFGALRTGLKYSDNYSKIIALSSALIIHQLKDMTPGFDNGMANYDYYAATFGDLSTAEERDCNPETIVLDKLNKGEKLPGIFMACGSEDFLIEPNRAFAEFLKTHNVPVEYRESAGIHNWKFWNEYIEPGIKWALGE